MSDLRSEADSEIGTYVELPLWWQWFGNGYYQRADGDAQVFPENEKQRSWVLSVWKPWKTGRHKGNGSTGRMVFARLFANATEAMLDAENERPFDRAKVADWKAAEFTEDGHLRRE